MVGVIGGPKSLPLFTRFSPLTFAAHLFGRLVFPEPDIDRLWQQVVGGPGQIGNFGNKFWLDPVDADRTSGEPKRVERGGGTLKSDFGRANGSRRRRRFLSTFWDMPVPTRPRVNQFALVPIIVQQQRAQVRPRPFGIGPSEDDEFLAV